LPTRQASEIWSEASKIYKKIFWLLLDSGVHLAPSAFEVAFLSEPMKKDHPLLNIKNKDNLYITPHIAWTSIEARKKLIEGVIQNIKETL